MTASIRVTVSSLLLLVSLGTAEGQVELTIFGASQPGGDVTGELRGPPGSPTFLALGIGFLDPAALVLGQPWYIDPTQPWIVTPLPPVPASGELVLPMVIPANPNLLGTFLHLQGAAGTTLTNVTSLRVHPPATTLTTGIPGEQMGLRMLGTDLDGDGLDELILTALEGGGGAGEVHVAFGPSTTPTMVLTDPTPQVGGMFGGSLLAADLVGSDDVDLLVASLGAGPASADLTGEVWIFEGPDFTNAILLLSPTPAPGSMFGSGITIGDFDGDTLVDLAIGEGGATVGGVVVAGRVQVFAGPALAPWTTLTQPDLGDTSLLAGFGLTLAAGDFDGDGADSLVVGAPGAVVQGQPQVGLGYRYDDLDQPPVVLMDKHPSASSAFACMVIVADVVGDARPDIIAGAPGAAGTPEGNPADVGRPGEMQIFDGGDPAVIFDFEDPTPEQLGHFGFSVHAADLDGDGSLDVIVGANLSDLGGAVNAGSAFVYMGPTLAIRAEVTGAVPFDNDQFGTMVGSVDSDGDGKRDLLVGAHLDDPAGATDAGSVLLVDW